MQNELAKKEELCGIFAFLGFVCVGLFLASVITFFIENWGCCPNFIITYIVACVAALLTECVHCVPELSIVAILARFLMTAALLIALIFMLHATETCDRTWRFYMNAILPFFIIVGQFFIIADRILRKCFPPPAPPPPPIVPLFLLHPRYSEYEQLARATA